MGGTNNTTATQHRGGMHHPSASSKQKQPSLEQVIELDDESGNISDTFLTLESLLDHDINLDEPLPLLPSTYEGGGAEPIPVVSSSAPNGNSTAATASAGTTASSANTTTTASTQQNQQQPPPDPDRVIVPHHHDVLLGRGGRNNQWSGNECLRQLARVMAAAYGSAHKRDKPALAWRLIQQVRSLDPPGRFLKQKVAAGDWFEVSDDIAREKASQCLRDIVAASRSGFADGNSRKRAYQSAPELNAKRMRVSLSSAGLGGVATGATTSNPSAMQNASFGQPILTPMMPTSMHPSLTTSPSTNSVARVMPPKAVSCMTLGGGAPNASNTNMAVAAAAAGSNPTTQYNDRLLQQLQLVRAQTQQQQFLAASADATAHSQRNLLQSMSTASNMNTSTSFHAPPGQQQATRSVSFAANPTTTTNHNASFSLQTAFPSQSGISSAGGAGMVPSTSHAVAGMGNSGWATHPTTNNGGWNNNNNNSASNTSMLMSTDNLQQQQQQPNLLGWQQQQPPQSGTNAAWGTSGGTTNASWGNSAVANSTVVASSSNNTEDALKRWIDRMTTTTGNNANGGGANQPS